MPASLSTTTPSDPSDAARIASVRAVATPSRRSRAALIVGARVLMAAAFIGLWSLGSRAGWLDPLFYSTPTRVLQALVEWFVSGSIWPQILATLEEALAGLFLGLFAALVVGFTLARNAVLGELFEPVLTILNAVPRIVLAPLLIMWFGIGPGSKIALSFLLVFFVVFFAVYSGVREIDEVLVRNARLLGARGFDLDREIYLPAALTWIFSSLRVAIGFAFTGAVVGEFLGATRGLGYLLSTAEGTFNTAQMLAGLVVVMVLIGGIFVVVQAIEARVMAWKAR